MMLTVEVTRSAQRPAGLLHAAQPAFLSIYVSGSAKDLAGLHAQLQEVADHGGHARTPANVQGIDGEIVVFRTEQWFSANPAEAALMLCGDAATLRSAAEALATLWTGEPVQGLHRHIEFGEPNGLGAWPSGVLTFIAPAHD
jgi:hypothetical protein